jgi:hypothetical protein
MHLLIFEIVVFAVLVLVVSFFKLKFGGVNPSSENSLKAGKYEAQQRLLTPAELSFFKVLEQAVGNDYSLFAKVRLADVIRPVRSESRSGFQTALNRITSKHVDFVVCDSKSLTILGVMELDDKTHERFERGIRDGFVDTALGQAGIPIIRIRAASTYLVNDLRDKIFSALSPSKTAK